MVAYTWEGSVRTCEDCAPTPNLKPTLLTSVTPPFPPLSPSRPSCPSCSSRPSCPFLNRIYYYPAQPQYSLCSSLTGDPNAPFGQNGLFTGLTLNICTETADDLLDLKAAIDAKNDTALEDKLTWMAYNSTRSFLADPSPVTQPFNWQAGCQAPSP